MFRLTNVIPERIIFVSRGITVFFLLGGSPRVGILCSETSEQSPVAGESLKRNNTTFRTRRKFETRNEMITFISVLRRTSALRRVQGRQLTVSRLKVFCYSALGVGRESEHTVGVATSCPLSCRRRGKQDDSGKGRK